MPRTHRDDRPRPLMPAFYMPAMWPLDLQNAIVDRLGAGWWRRRMHRLLRQDERGVIRLGRARGVVKQGICTPLRLIAQRRACW